jgi:hypothetical protein
MRIISIVELERDPRADSSYYPIPFVPNKGSQIPEDERSQYSVRYLPVHYFDYIGKLLLCTYFLSYINTMIAGTSTGG